MLPPVQKGHAKFRMVQISVNRKRFSIHKHIDVNSKVTVGVQSHPKVEIRNLFAVIKVAGASRLRR